MIMPNVNLGKLTLLTTQKSFSKNTWYSQKHKLISSLRFPNHVKELDYFVSFAKKKRLKIKS